MAAHTDTQDPDPVLRLDATRIPRIVMNVEMIDEAAMAVIDRAPPLGEADLFTPHSLDEILDVTDRPVVMMVTLK